MHDEIRSADNAGIVSGSPQHRRGRPSNASKLGEKMAEVTEPKVQGMSIQDVISLITQMNAQNQTSLIEAVKELKKPNEFEQAKLDKERLQLQKKAEDHVKFGRIEENKKIMRLKNCQHSRFNPSTKISNHLWRAQVHDGDQGKPYFIPLCQECLTDLPKIYCSQDQIKEGVGLDRYPSLNVDVLLTWAEQSGNKEVRDFRQRYKIMREAA